MAQPNGKYPQFQRVTLGTGTFIITGGIASGTTAITAEVGSPCNGSVYFSGAGNGEIWVMLNGTWTSLTIN